MSRPPLPLLGLVLSLVIVFIIGAASSTKPVRMEFYSVAAQVLPVLFVVLAIEVRLFRLPPKRALDTEGGTWLFVSTFVLSMVLLFLLAAEYWALRPLASGTAADGSPQIVRTALGHGFVTIAYLALFGERNSQAP